MTGRGLAAAAIALLAFCAPAGAEQFVGPNASFTLEFGPEWEVIQAENRAGLTCNKSACGEDRVYCVMLPRSDEAAVPGKPLPDLLVRKFGDGIVSSPTQGGAKMTYVTPFGARTLGGTPGSWAEIVSNGEKGSTHFGLFLFAAPGFDIAFTCGAPEARWEAHRAKIETLLTSAKIGASPPVAPDAPDAGSPPAGPGSPY